MLKDESGANPGGGHTSMLGSMKQQYLPGSELCPPAPALPAQRGATQAMTARLTGFGAAQRRHCRQQAFALAA